MLHKEKEEKTFNVELNRDIHSCRAGLLSWTVQLMLLSVKREVHTRAVIP
jgi:hypothetical protein